MIRTTLAEGWRAEELFTNRVREVQSFLDALQRPPSDAVLFFHGDGGNGKSLLMRILAKRYCDVPWAMLDFGMAPRGEDRPQEPLSALLMLRRKLAASGLRFHIFDLAVVLYLRSTHRLSGDRLRDFLPNEELDAAAAIVDALGGTAWGSIAAAILNVFEKRAAEAFTVWSRERKVSREMVEELLHMDAELELIDVLPEIFAADVNASMRGQDAPRRVVLFFDGHDAFWREQRRSLSPDVFFQRDEWFRRLVTSIKGDSGVVLVVAGRELPRWPEARRFPIAARQLESHPVDNLGTPDAETYLTKAGVTDSAMRAEILRITTVASGEHHPLSMALCADALAAAAAKGQRMSIADLRAAAGDHVGGEVVERLLRHAGGDLDDGVRALAACRAFDDSLFYRLGDALRFGATAADFRLLTSMSFVWRSTEEQYRIHDLVRKLLHDSADPVLRRAHAFLEEYFAGEGNQGEAAYHANRIDRSRGARLWLDALDLALESTDIAAARTLLQLTADIELDGAYENARLTRLSGDFEAVFGRADAATRLHKRALRLLRQAEPDAETLAERALVLVKQGEVYAEQLAGYRRASALFRRALEATDAAAEAQPDSPLAWSTRSYALLAIAEMKLARSEYESAKEYYANAAKAAEEALRLRPEWGEALSNKGHALCSEAEVTKKLGDARGAVDLLREGVAHFRRAIELREMAGTATANLIWALAELADALTNVDDDDGAQQVYLEGRAFLEPALRQWPENVFLAVNASYLLNGYGDWLSARDDNDAAREQHLRVYEVMRGVLEFAPADIRALSNASYALMSLGVIDQTEERYDAARLRLQEAVSLAARGLIVAPSDPALLANRGTASRALAEVLESEQVAADAVADLRRSAALSPADSDPALELARALALLARLRAERGFEDEADLLYDDALRASEPFLETSVDHVHHAATVRIERAELAPERSRFDTALAWFDAAPADFDRYDGDSDLRKTAFDALLGSARMLKTAGRSDEALQRVEEALAASAREGMPAQAYHEALAHAEAGHIEILRRRFDAARTALRAALQAIRDSDGDVEDRIEEAWIHHRLAEVSAGRFDGDALRRHSIAARAICEGVLAERPNSVPAHSILAAMAAFEGERAKDHATAAARFRDAVAACDRALRHAPFDRNMRWQKADAGLRLAAITGDRMLFDAAAASLQQLLAEAPAEPAFLESVALIAQLRSRLD